MDVQEAFYHQMDKIIELAKKLENHKNEGFELDAYDPYGDFISTVKTIVENVDNNQIRADLLNIITDVDTDVYDYIPKIVGMAFNIAANAASDDLAFKSMTYRSGTDKISVEFDTEFEQDEVKEENKE